MRRKFSRLEVREVETYDLCDRCSQPLQEGNVHVFHIEGGWGSTFPGDLASAQVEVCSDCVETWVKGFMHDPFQKGEPCERVAAWRGDVLYHVWYGEWAMTPEESELQQMDWTLPDADAWEHPDWSTRTRDELRVGPHGILQFKGYVRMHPSNEIYGLIQELYGYSKLHLTEYMAWVALPLLDQSLPSDND